jgi:hypothetical protein
VPPLFSPIPPRFHPEKIQFELWNGPNVSRRFYIELGLVQSQGIEVLLAEEQRLLRKRYELRSVIKFLVDYFLTELPIAFGEQLMFVPNLIDNLGRSYVRGADDAKINKALVFVDGS